MMNPYFVGRVDAVFERELYGVLELYNLPVVGFVGGTGPPLVRHLPTGEIVEADLIPGYLRVIYTQTEPTVFHFCHSDSDRPEAWTIHYAEGNILAGFQFRD